MGCCWHLRRAKSLRRSIAKGIRALPAAGGPGPGAVPATRKATPATTATTTAYPPPEPYSARPLFAFLSNSFSATFMARSSCFADPSSLLLPTWMNASATA